MRRRSTAKRERCIRKGLADQCVDGYRKKAKYLLEEDDISPTVQQPTLHMEAPPSGPDMFVNNLHENMAIPEASSFSPTVFKQTSKDFGRSEPSAAFAFDPKTAFGFDPTSLECSILTSMLHDADSSALSGDSPDVAHIPAMDLMENYTTLQSSAPGGSADDGTSVPPVASWKTQSHMQPMSDRRDSTGSFTKQGIYMGSLGQQMKQNNRNSPSSLDTNVVFSPEALVQAGKSTAQRACADETNPSHEHSSTTNNINESIWKQRVSRVYNDRVKPFRYTDAYHILLKYVMLKYEKADVLRIVRALAIFRPSLIALQMPLSEEDEVFVERAFQRTILEFEKLISFSGTPTVVWRRTCEISLVGSEFCMLTQWSKEDLMGKYIYQFMDKSSVLKYW
ncbi:Transcriptional regulator of nonfermentable carbon utilization [Malassezia vespertilionis]|uniref:Transcriptional regulator of nonfermentable carbon utilization n=1 Tax=Malassezia vespertilionis TaxID=2020962 RepID=UPI0024B07E9D|nr:Transcriptional regulator of nonfermentable carbon utilization [Malassezia vespertilionis]WFD07304.1 Transcriptional regulator of nonfermentable carbon utilization [Malassezia vespertilionis]